MVHFVKGNLLDGNCDYICHQVNCKGVMGAGIAKQIRDRWPEVFISYREYCNRHDRDPKFMLGNIWGVQVTPNCVNRWVVNMFAQNDYGYNGSRFTSYDAFAKCLEVMRDRLPKDKTIGFPKGIGCGLGGGDWEIILRMIENVLGDTHEVFIYELED